MGFLICNDATSGIYPCALQEIIPSQPLHLWAGIPVHDIAFLVLEVPGNDNQDVPLADPDFLLDLSLDPAHPGNTVKTAYADVVCSHHQFGIAEDLPVPFLGEFDPDDLISRGC